MVSFRLRSKVVENMSFRLGLRSDQAQPRPPWLRKAVAGLCYFYAGCIVALAALIYVVGEESWLTTLFLFGPLWVLSLPLALIAVLWLIYHRGLVQLALLAISGVILWGPVMAFNIPWERLLPHGTNGRRIRVITWNIEEDKVKTADLAKLLQTQRPDIVVLQECRPEVLVGIAPEWQRHESGWMCLLSRFPIREIADRDRTDVYEKGGSGAIIRYSLEAPFGILEMTNVHLETPREGFEDFLGGAVREGIKSLTAKNEQRYDEAALAVAWVNAGKASARLVAGDFNTTPQSDLLRESWIGYTDCFDAAGFGLGHSKYTRKIGVRIDHVLASAGWHCAAATTLVRTGDSDHVPVQVDLEWTDKSTS